MKTHMLKTPGGFSIACGKWVENQDAKTSDPAKVTCRACLKSVTYRVTKSAPTTAAAGLALASERTQ